MEAEAVAASYGSEIAMTRDLEEVVQVCRAPLSPPLQQPLLVFALADMPDGLETLHLLEMGCDNSPAEH